jgi:long-chain acyl-CoA synthetase
MKAAPWTKLYPGGVGPDLIADHPTMIHAFDAAVAARADASAMIYFDQPLSYAKLDGDSDALACWLGDHGISKGDRVCIVTQNVPAFAQMSIAAWKAGAVIVPGNPMYRAPEFARIFSDSEPRIVLCQYGEADAIKAGLSSAGRADTPVVVVSPYENQTRNDERVLPASSDTHSATRVEDILLEYAGRRPERAALEPDDLALILYTSGTTGLPKGAMLTHGGLTFNSKFLRDWCGLDDRDLILAVAPFFHVTGFVCHMCAAIVAQCSMVLHYRFEPNVVLEMIRTHRPTLTVAAITAFNAMMSAPDASAEDMQSLTKVYSGGAPIPPALRDSIQKRFGFTILPCYGMTELTSPAVFAPPGIETPQRDDVLSIGIPIPSTEVKIVGDDDVVQVLGAAGEILIRGPQVMAGYWRKPEDTAAAITDGWMRTGDVGFMDEQGWIYLVDRKKDMIIASGFKVWPREVEDVLYSHRAVREAAVIGVPDAYRGESVKACVSLKVGQSTSEEDLIAFCRERLTGYKVPRLVEIMDDLPKTVSGKIQRAALRGA